jgi:DNA-binding NarL/FixJ family response regulator
MITVMLVDDHPLMRKGIRSVLEPYGDINIIGEASNGLEAVNLANALKPSVIIMDVNMPQMDGVQATRLIKQSLPRTTIIGLSVNESDFVKRALLQAGASTYLNKDNVGEDLYLTISGFRAI